MIVMLFAKSCLIGRALVRQNLSFENATTCRRSKIGPWLDFRGVQIAACCCPRQEGVSLPDEAFPLLVVCCWSV